MGGFDILVTDAEFVEGLECFVQGGDEAFSDEIYGEGFAVDGAVFEVGEDFKITGS